MQVFVLLLILFAKIIGFTTNRLLLLCCILLWQVLTTLTIDLVSLTRCCCSFCLLLPPSSTTLPPLPNSRAEVFLFFFFFFFFFFFSGFSFSQKFDSSTLHLSPIGDPVSNVSSVALVNGTAKFSDEEVVCANNMLYCAPVLSTVTKGSFVVESDVEARKLVGVVDIM
jgi:hypothetical protein